MRAGRRACSWQAVAHAANKRKLMATKRTRIMR